MYIYYITCSLDPMCLDDEVECDREEPVSSTKPVLPKLKRTLRSNTSAPTLSDSSDWNVIDLLNDTSEIQFGNVTLLPVNVEVRGEREKERKRERERGKEGGRGRRGKIIY